MKKDFSITRFQKYSEFASWVEDDGKGLLVDNIMVNDSFVTNLHILVRNHGLRAGWLALCARNFSNKHKQTAIPLTEALCIFNEIKDLVSDKFRKSFKEIVWDFETWAAYSSSWRNSHSKLSERKKDWTPAPECLNAGEQISLANFLIVFSIDDFVNSKKKYANTDYIAYAQAYSIWTDKYFPWWKKFIE